jgi:hypothetical protein
MIVEQRTYTLSPGSLKRFLAAYEESGLPLHREIYQRLVGYYVSESGTLNQIVQLWAFESYEDRAARRARLQADPRWDEYLQKVKGLVIQQESRMLAPTAWSPPS